MAEESTTKKPKRTGFPDPKKVPAANKEVYEKLYTQAQEVLEVRQEAATKLSELKRVLWALSGE
tara:strand:+ start:295 stop:486 length:192 start_codon:yes stop_codon:yes gene_type:complete